MSAHCNDCGADLVYTQAWPEMECPVCTVTTGLDHLREALERIVVCCDNGSKAHNKIAFIRRVAADAISRTGPSMEDR